MRVISWFSCGAASAYATFLAKEKYSGNQEVSFEAVYCKVLEEHPDNMRFLEEYSKLFNIPVKTIGNEKYDYSIFNVFKQRRFIKGPSGAPCTMVLKKDVRKKYQKPNDVHVFGYTCEEEGRINRFIDSNNDLETDFILMANKATKKDCLDFLAQSNLTIPTMYKLGYNNNNCVGCVKGGMGYWNKIRKDFPDVFLKMAKLERELNHSLNKDKNGSVFLDELSPDRGNFTKDSPLSCGFTCEWKQKELF